jgi:hypothetical protein
MRPLPFQAPTNRTNKTFHALIDKNTQRVTLPVPDGEQVMFSIKGDWGDLVDGPGSTLVELRVRTRKHGRIDMETRLSKDAAFPLPAGSIQIWVKVLHASGAAKLRAEVAPLVAPTVTPTKSRPLTPLPPVRKDIHGLTSAP